MKNWIYLHYTGFLNYTRALTNSVILLGLPNAHMGANCVPLLTDLFLYSYKADFIQRFLKKNEKKMTRSFNVTFRYIDDVLSLNNSRFSDIVDCIYPIELEIKDTTDTARSASYFDLHLEIESE